MLFGRGSGDTEVDDTTTFYESEYDDDDDDTYNDDASSDTDSMSYDASLMPRRRRRLQERTLLQQERQRRVVDLAATSSEDVTYYTSSFGEEVNTVEDEATTTDDQKIPPISPVRSHHQQQQLQMQPQQQPNTPMSPAMAESASFTSRASESTGPPPKMGSPRVLNRVPGGAAAKLMLMGPRGSQSDSTSGVVRKSSSESTHRLNQDDVLTGLENELLRAREEYVTGAAHAFPDATSLATPSTATTTTTTTPSFLNRSEAFHATASAAVAALLSQDASGAPNTDFATFPSSPAHYEAKPVVSPYLLDKTTEQKVENLESKMLDPTDTLTGLLTAIASPEQDLADPLGYHVRRKNACGALQTMTANPSNRSRICWTVGVLPALTSVLQDGLEVIHRNSKTSDRIRTEYQAAQTRAIAALMNLSMPVKNRIAVFHSPGLVRAALSTVDQQTGNARHGCTAILAFLAKSPENRLLLAQVPGLLDVMCKVLQPRAPVAKKRKDNNNNNKVVYPWSDENSVASSATRSKAEEDEGAEKEDDNDTQKDDFESPPSLTMSYDDSNATAKQAGRTPCYDETADALLRGARQNCFAMLGHLVKEKDNAYHFARDLNFLTTLVEISQYQQSSSHTLAVQILAHLTRHRLNKVLAFKPKIVIPALVQATQSPSDETRLYACYALQNLSQEKSCRQELAIADQLIEALCERCRVATRPEERLATISTLKNLCDEPANLIPMTNTADCVSTLMQMADSDDDALLQYRACDALATLSHWLRKIATSGYSLDASEQGRPAMKGLFVPTLREVSWNQWT